MSETQLLHRQLGAIVHPATETSPARTRFTLWAPTAKSVTVELIDSNLDGRENTSVAMRAGPSGYHTAEIDHVSEGTRYFYRVDGGPPRPDPASRYQPEGVHGPSEVVDGFSYRWNDESWSGHDRDDLIIYELHIGTFTAEGTFLAAIDRIEELVDLGVTAIELMPVAACAGRWNWGYDGVALFAPMDAYGHPNDFRRFVDAAHAAGLSVLLDVVYNHLGPEGNYLHDFGPYLSARHKTVWGDAPNFDDPEYGDHVRAWFIANTLYWLDEFHLDGLRVDAIHCMEDDRDPHVVAEMAEHVDRFNKDRKRNAVLIAESNVYDPEMTVRRDKGGIGFDAMWGDDFLHSVFAVLRPGEQLCHRAYRAKTDLTQVLRFGYVYEGTLRSQRERRELDARVSTHDLVYSIQNHDFIGNHPLGVRLHQLTSDEAQRAAAALLIMVPAIPMLFMGEEFACPNPFRFFVDFSDEGLRKAVVEGRRREYPQHDWEGGVLPTDRKAFDSAKIGDQRDGNAETLRWYRELIQLRKKFRASGLLTDAHLKTRIDQENDLYILDYRHDAQHIAVVVRLCSTMSKSDQIECPLQGRVLLDSARIGDSLSDHKVGPMEENRALIIEMNDL